MNSEKQTQSAAGIDIERLNGGIEGSVVSGRDSAGRDIIQQQTINFYPSAPRPQASDLLLFHHFDLTELVRCCSNELDNMQGLSGFIIPCDSTTLLTSFCERMKYELGREWVDLRNNLVVKASHTSLENAVNKLIKVYTPATQHKDVLCGIQIEPEQLSTFWQNLCVEYNNECRNRLIVILAVDAECSPERNLKPLPSPLFQFHDMRTWTRQLCEALQWSKQDFERWLDLIRQVWQCESLSHIEGTYDYLEMVIDLLKEEPQPEKFFEKLQERCL